MPPKQQKTPQAAPPASTRSLQILDALPRVARRFAEVDALHDALRQLAPRCHLLTPTLNPEMVPEFHEVSVRTITVNPSRDGGEVYELPGGNRELALTKVALDRIAAAAGISWDPVRSGRLDDGSDPHYCHFRAVGFVRDLDGGRRVLVGEKVTDLREGNPNIFTEDPQRMAREWDTQARRYTDRVKHEGFVKGWSQVRLDGAREHILPMTESKAKNRVIRALGLRPKYTAEELQKPFVVLGLILTGRSSDPELERLAKERMLTAAISASRELFGGDPPRSPGPLPPPIERIAPPPVPTEREPGEDDDVIEIARGEDCGCPDGPADQHEPGCRLGGGEDGD